MKAANMTARLIKLIKLFVIIVAAVVVTIFAVRAYDARRGPPLELWEKFVPDELDVAAIDATDWAGYLKAEDEIFASVKREVTDVLPEHAKIASNRFFAGSPLYPESFATNWNRSFELDPQGEPRGAVVLLHGLTDAPYSLRHVGQRYRDQGFVAVGIRMPGHGTVPGGLTEATWQQWMATTRLAVREAASRIGPDKPLHIVGYSNGGALAVLYALDALVDPSMRRPDRLVLMSPMIGITTFARFAGLAGLPAILPPFVRAAWLDISPEFNPFKYNSFPVYAARQSYQLTSAVRSRINEVARTGRLGELPPILTFQSILDHTVSTRAVISTLYGQLPDNGSELVLIDINRAGKFGPLLSPAAETSLGRLLPAAPRKFRTTVLANIDSTSGAIEARVSEAGAIDEKKMPLGLAYPNNIYSMSHIALPFPPTDSLYGFEPDPNENFGINLGAIAPRGEIGALIVGIDTILRVSSNPFYPYFAERIDEGITAPQ